AFTGHPQVPVLPVRFAAQTLPQGPGLTFTWPDAQAILLEGTVYVGDELRLLPANPDLPLTTITAAQVRVSGLGALTLAFVGQPAPLWLLDSPLITPAGMTIRWAGPAGGLLESAPTPLGPWSPVPGQSNGSVVLGSPLTNSVPSQFFRVRTN
ncbi:MAG TPA: hypothetical protein VNT26_21650, partial [Candidatus Sulfotelmatobacter sp.]|nr:hypothetical protein [Candidatus Sulfotelmatobacter sp.]